MSGSFVNQTISGGNQREPKIGDAVTICHYSDRNPGTITDVIRFKSGAKKGEIRAVMVRGCDWRIVKGSEQDGSAQYEYSEREDAPSARFTRNSRGQYTQGGYAKLAIGHRERYYDPSF